MKLLRDEKVLVESDRGKLVLTTHRVRYESRFWGRAEIISIMLEDVCSCQITQTSKPAWMYSACLVWLLALASLVVEPENIGLMSSELHLVFWPAVVIGAMMAVVYASSRKQVLSVASAGMSIEVLMQGVGLEVGAQFVDSVAAAKNAHQTSTAVTSDDIAIP